MNNRFTKTAQNALNMALESARELSHSYVGSEHLLLGLLSESEGVAAKILLSKGIDHDRVYGIVETAGSVGSAAVTATDMTPRTKRIIERSALEANRFGHNYIGTEHLLLSLLEEPDCIAVKILISCGIYVSDLVDEILGFFREGSEQPEETQKTSAKTKNSARNSGHLSKFGSDLTEAARNGKIDPIIGRDEETQRVIQILSRRTKNNPCLIGEPGVGKTAVVEGLAQRIVEKNVPETLQNKIVFRLDLSSMIAGAKYRGEFEERMKGVMEEVVKNPDIILFIDEIHTIIGAGAAEGAVDAANIIKPALARGEMQVIGATTINEYRKHIEKDAALERRFQSVMVGEPSEEEAVLILKGLRDKYEAHHKVKITDEAIAAAVSMSRRYIADRYLPDKAIDLIDEAASRCRIDHFTAPDSVKKLEEKLTQNGIEKEAAIKSQNFELAASLRDKEKKLREELALEKEQWNQRCGDTQLSIGESEIAEIVTAWTGIPVKRLSENEGERLLRLETELHQRVIGQDEAVTAVAKAIKRGRVGLKDPKRPMGSFIFLGPTGVGKTELAKTISEILFGDDGAMIRLDMSEYMEKHSVSKLIGSPPGYVGYDEGGQLTEKVRRRPYSVILFDEIEKAHPDVFNMLLQILDEGQLTDSQGRKVDFKNTIVIMTSNVGASGITASRSLGFTASGDQQKSDVKDRVMNALKQTFRPEFLNRIDEIVVFEQLSEGDIREIARLMLSEVKCRVDAMNIDLSFDDSLIDKLAKEGFDPVYGARPLRRAIRRTIEDALSNALLEGKLKENDKAICRLENDAVVFQTVE
ncbi:MAG: ATP-dependent Clp protease ATP-binding subunit [Ruminococcaceae bacterium]|nr:ATP-dependent Clp protease ATP-binding subunit [Oscillospiraceae bacterium]